MGLHDETFWWESGETLKARDSLDVIKKARFPDEDRPNRRELEELERLDREQAEGWR